MRQWVNIHGCEFVIDKMNKREIADAIGYRLSSPQFTRADRFIVLTAGISHSSYSAHYEHISIVETYRTCIPHSAAKHDHYVRRVMKKWSNVFAGNLNDLGNTYHKTLRRANLMTNELNKVADKMDFGIVEATT